MVRLLTYNVHGFTNVKKENTADHIMNNIFHINPDIIILQEVTLPILKKVSIKKKDIILKLNQSGYNYIVFSKDNTNLIASKSTFEADEIDLGKDTKYKVSRNALVVVQNNVVIVGTHLDVFDESGILRSNQINIILNHLHDNYNNINNIIIAGDFNSLRKADYSDDEFKIIVNDDLKRKVITIEDVIPILENNGFQDSFVVSSVKPPTNSVWSKRRIDYIMGKNIKFISSTIIEDYASDHFPIYADF